MASDPSPKTGTDSTISTNPDWLTQKRSATAVSTQCQALPCFSVISSSLTLEITAHFINNSMLYTQNSL